MSNTQQIKFQKYYVTDGQTKARVHYSNGQIIRDGQLAQCITLYAKDYSDDLGKVFADGRYQNDSDLHTDYFDKGRVRIFPGDPLYVGALSRCQARAA